MHAMGAENKQALQMRFYYFLLACHISSTNHVFILYVHGQDATVEITKTLNVQAKFTIETGETSQDI